MVTRSCALVEQLQAIPDPRRQCLNLKHRLVDVLLIGFGGVLADCDDFVEIADWPRHHDDFLRTFLELPNGIPAHDTFRRVFAAVQPAAVQGVLIAWLQQRRGLPGEWVHIDGKALRGSRCAARGLGALHLVSAWASQQGLTLGQVAVDAKSNEITAIPALLELLDLGGALVTIDAMGCQKAVAQKIVDRDGDYILTVKDNQEHLLEDIERSVAQAFDTDFAGLEHDAYETRERGHGREEYRSYTVIHSTAGLRHAADWRKLTTIGMCYSERTVGGVTSEETRYFIGSRKASAKTYGKALRNHWGIENSLHWQLDVTFAEDDNRVGKRNAAENLALLRRRTLSLLQAHPSKLSIAKKRYAAALDPDFLEEILRGNGILEKP